MDQSNVYETWNIRIKKILMCIDIKKKKIQICYS